MSIHKARLRHNLILFFVTSAVFLVSFVTHLPGKEYSDVVSIFATRITSSKVPLPYIQTHFEYPIITGLVYYVATKMGFYASKSNPLFYYYFFTSAVLYAFTLATVFETRALLQVVVRPKTSLRPLLLYMVVTPSFVWFLTYNWYIIGTYLTIRGLREFFAGKFDKCAVFFGLSAASNLITAAPLLALLAKSDVRRAFRLTAFFGATWSLVNAPIAMLNFSGFVAQFTWHLNWYVEDSWLLLYPPYNKNIFDAGAKAASGAVLLVLLSAVLLIRNSNISRRIIPFLQKPLTVLFLTNIRCDAPRNPSLWSATPVRRTLGDAWLVQAVVLFSSYIYAPQLNITILPLFALTFSEFGLLGYLGFIAFDLVNLQVITNWFLTSDPWNLPSITQVFSVLRCVILILLVAFYLRMHRTDV
jgi:hypothetical protein